MNPGWRTFLIVWFGQVASLLGTAMTRFALLIWAYQQTGAATSVALLGFFSFVPFVVIGPLAGAVVDRVDRRVVMIVADLGAGLSTVAILALLATGELAIWHLFAAAFLSGMCEAFQGPAYSAASTLLVTPQDYSRVNGLRSLADAAAQVAAPALAGLLLVGVGLHGVLLVDIATFLVAVTALCFVRFPAPPPIAGDADRLLRADLVFGVRYIVQRPGLVGLLIVFMGMNLFGTLTYMAVLPAMILARTDNDQLGWAAVQVALGAGSVVGALIASGWRGPARRVHLIYGGSALSFLMGDLLFALGRSVPVWTVAAFLASVFIPLIMAGERAIWQSKVPPALQGRVFAANNMLRMATMPVGYLLAGPLADRVFEPAMAAGGSLTPLFGPLLGEGPGAGMALMFLCTWALGTLNSLSGYLWRPARRVELDLPDHTAAAPANS